MTASYQYKPLYHPEINIRLLYLLPAISIESSLKCKLRVSSEISKHKYEALSYVWGSPTRDRPLLCDDGTVYITSNCEAALRRLRRKTRRRVLWVDSVCINQSDDNEKSHQVRLMSQIYSKAATVLVWLENNSAASLDAGSTRAIRIFAWLLDRSILKKHWELAYKDLRRALQNSDSCHVFRQYSTQSQWFYRVWTFQEIAVAKSAVLICGRQAFTWDLYIDLVSFDSERWNSILAPLQSSVILRSEIQKLYISQEGSLDPISDTGELLLYGTHSTASNHRDYVYGLQAIWVLLGMKLPPPSYTKSVAQVFEDMTRALIQRTEKLDVLWRILQSRTNKHRLSSWVYDWQDKDWVVISDYFWKGLLGLHIQSLGSRANVVPNANYTLQSRYLASHTAIPGQLIIHGRLLGNVREVWDSLPQCKDSHGVLLPDEHLRSINKMFRDDVELSPEERAVIETIDWIAQLLRNWTYAASEADKKRTHTRRKFSRLRHVDSLVWVLFRSIQGIDSPELRASGRRTVLDEQSSMWKTWIQSVYPTMNFPKIGNIDIKLRIDNEEFPNLEAVSCTRPFVLDTGYLGLETKFVKPGDKIILAAGSKYPLAIRPIEDLYELVCPCAIAGIEDGQAWHGNNVPDFDWPLPEQNSALEDATLRDLQEFILI